MSGEKSLESQKVSIVCCYTSKAKLRYLDCSLDEQDMAVEKVFIDNSQGRFGSAASALNYGANMSSGDLILFCHQDIRFKHSDSLSRLVKAASSTLKPGDVGGVAGAINKKLYMTITHGEHEAAYSPAYLFNGDSVEVETVDECVIILPRETWLGHHFDEVVCDNWHFYGVEQCLYALAHNHNVYVLSADVNHLSSRGKINDTYYRALRRLMRAYENKFDYVSTTVGYWPRRHLESAIAKRRIFECTRAIAVRLGIRDA
ncbi:MAG: hypothetical protein DUD33_09180 [Coriobacteriaceae bacterium]|nr:MAG: hypothetical protein DUD33_09180 [Coriobacteriaceae bacterium]